MTEKSPSSGYSEAEKLRQILHDRLYDEGAITLANKIAKCGEEVPLNCTGCGRRRVGRTRCDQRWCPVCQRALAARTSLRYAAIAQECQWPLVCTFTTTHTKDSFLSPKEIRRAFTKLRRLRWWKAAVKGGVAAFELTDTGKGWHTHVHALLDCRWLSVRETPPAAHATAEAKRAKAKRSLREVSQQWTLCTGRKATVHARRGRGGSAQIGSIAQEVLKYAVKGSDLVAMKGPVAPVIRSMAGSRLVVSWGNFYRHEAVKRPKPAPAMCQCGCSDWMLERQVDALVRTLR